MTTPRKILGDVDREALDRLVNSTADLARDDLRLADGQLEALATHGLDKHGELELAATLHLPGVGTLGLEHPDRDVAHELRLEAVVDHARSQA